MDEARVDTLHTPSALRVAGALLVASAAMPFSPGGRPFWQLVAEAFGAHPLQGILVAFGYGAPFWFGLCLLLAPKDLTASGAWSRIAQWTLGLLHAQLLLTAWMLARAGVGVGAWFLFGFALVAGLHFASSGARFSASSARMSGAAPPAWWLARWGALVVMVLCAWLRLQALGDLRLGYAVEAAWMGSLVATLVLTRLRLPVSAGSGSEAAHTD